MSGRGDQRSSEITRTVARAMAETSVTSAPSKTRRTSDRPRHKPRVDAGGLDPPQNGEQRFPSVRAVQAGRAYFVTACPLPMVPKILSFDSPDLPPQLRAQRVLNKGRIPRIADYLAANPTSYVLSAITASIDADVRFEEEGSLRDGVRVGQLVVPAGARILVNDGQHRRAAIAKALATTPELVHESVPLVLFLDAGLERSQQIFADLNRHAIRPTTSLNVLYDKRDEVARLARRVASEVCPFADLTELERSSLSNRSSSMFTLSAIHQATRALLSQRSDQDEVEADEEQVLEFWEIVGELIRGWGFIGEDGRTAADLRRDYIHAHGVALHALGIVGGALQARYPSNWQARLRRLKDLDWARSNPTWDGRALRNGRISKAGPALILTANVLRNKVGVELSSMERAVEETMPKESRVAA